MTKPMKPAAPKREYLTMGEAVAISAAIITNPISTVITIISITYL